MIDFSKFKESGDLYLPYPIRNFLGIYLIGSPTSLVYIKLWSILHMISGMIVGYFLRYYTRFTFMESILMGLIIHTLWELWQYIIKNTQYTLRGYIDIFVDTIMFMIGFLLIYS